MTCDNVYLAGATSMVLHLSDFLKTLGSSRLVDDSALSLNLEGDGGASFAHVIEHSAGVHSRVLFVDVGDIQSDVAEVECSVEPCCRLQHLAVVVPLNPHAGVVDRLYAAFHVGSLAFGQICDALK